MIQIGTNLITIDNSGAKLVTCIGCLAGYKQRYASFGEVITVAVQKLRKRRRTLVKVKKGQVLQALIIRTKKNLTKASNLFFFENAAVLLNKQKKLIGTRVFGSLPKSLRFSKYLRLTFLARGLII
jgi:large subunit ribosomal protein L14